MRLLTDKEEGYISGLLFGIGMGMLIGVYILWV